MNNSILPNIGLLKQTITILPLESNLSIQKFTANQFYMKSGQDVLVDEIKSIFLGDVQSPLTFYLQWFLVALLGGVVYSAGIATRGITII